MDHALSPDQPAGGGGADDQLAGGEVADAKSVDVGGTDDHSTERYAIGARLSDSGSVRTFSATDHWLHRPVVVVFDAESGGRTLDTTCQAMAGVLSPYLIDIFDRGSNATDQFAVCEYPMSTVASLVQEPEHSLWNEGWAIDTAKQLAVALCDLRSSGIENGGLHLGHIGVDGNGRVRLSPWPLAEPPGDSSVSASDLELVVSVLESGAQVRGSSPTTAALVARLRRGSNGGSPLTLQQLPGVLAGLGVPHYDGPAGEVSVTATVPSQDSPHRTIRWPRLRPRWPLAIGAGLAALAALFAISLHSSNRSAPTAATIIAARTCDGKTKPCPVLNSPITTIAIPHAPVAAAIAPATTTTAPPPSGAAPRVGSSPTTAPPATVATPTTTTTTAPPPTTTTSTAAS